MSADPAAPRAASAAASLPTYSLPDDLRGFVLVRNDQASSPTATAVVATSALQGNPSHSATPAALRALTALPRGAVSSRDAGKRRRGKRDVIRCYNIMGARPSKAGPDVLQTMRAVLMAESTLCTTSTTVPVNTSFNVSLGSFAKSPAYLALFDQYRIDLIEVWVYPRDVASGSTSYSDYASCIDLDDANTPSTIDDVENRQGAVVAYGGAGRYLCWQPHMAVAVFSGAFTSYGNELAGWIDSASPSVQHFGAKFSFSPTLFPVPYGLSIRIHVSFRGAGR